MDEERAVKIVVFGATGRIGGKLVSGGIARGHEVTAAARHPERIPARHHAPRLVTCDLLDAADRRLYQAKHEGRDRVCG